MQNATTVPADGPSCHSGASEATQLIQRIRTSPPSRKVQDGRSNVTGRYPSQKMGHTIQFESHKVELAFIREYEFDAGVLEYYDQPGPIKISYQTNSGRKTVAFTTPDFFVIRSDGTAGWEECKSEQDLERLAEKSERFVRDDNGKWRCPPGEEHAAKYGFYFRIRSSAEINWVWQRNIEYLSDYLQAPEHPVTSDARSFIKALVSCKQGILLSELIENADRYSPDDLFHLIACNDLYVDLYTHSLSEQNRTPVYTCPEHAPLSTLPGAVPGFTSVMIEPGARLVWDSKLFNIVNTGEGKVWLMGEEGTVTPLEHARIDELVGIGAIRGMDNTSDSSVVRELLAGKSPAAHADANIKYNAIAPYLSGATASQPSSTIYIWLSRYREAEIRYGYGYLGLLDRKNERGNRLPKLPKESYDLMEASIGEQYLSSTEISPTTVYGHYRNLCEKSGVVSASFKTFMKKLKQLDMRDTLLSRQGARAAYQVDVFYWELEFTTPRHGDRPFEIAHLDHTELDIEVVDSTTGGNLGRPWLTLMNDANSRRVLAWILSFEPPSYRSCMLVMRECVRIHGRLPQTVVVDRGADFNSVYFEQLLAMHGITKKERPGAKPRYGSVLERLFGMTNQRFIHALRGNTKIMRNVRQVTKSVNPANLAVWTLPKLQERLGRYFSEVYDELEHPALGESPGNAFMRGLAQHGIRSMKLVRYDEAFILSTLPSTPRGRAKVVRSRGIKINNFYYWHENLRFAAGTDVAIRYDPFDIATAYAFVKGQWLCCYSQYYAILRGRSEKELALITQEILKRRSNHSCKVAINAQKVAAFIAESQGIELELKGMRQAAEMRIRNTGQVNSVAPEPVLPPSGNHNTGNDFETYDELTI